MIWSVFETSSWKKIIAHVGCIGPNLTESGSSVFHAHHYWPQLMPWHWLHFKCWYVVLGSCLPQLAISIFKHFLLLVNKQSTSLINTCILWRDGQTDEWNRIFQYPPSTFIDRGLKLYTSHLEWWPWNYIPVLYSFVYCRQHGAL